MRLIQEWLHIIEYAHINRTHKELFIGKEKEKEKMSLERELDPSDDMEHIIIEI